MRYTEARMAPAAVAMTASIDEDTVDFRPNYDGRELEPSVLPAAVPHLVVNGASGIAVGMATNLAPHNLVEVVQALRHLVKHPGADLDTIMRFVPGPDLPGGGKIIGLDGIRDAYETGRGSFRMRATTRIESVTARRKGIVVTELPYAVGTERVIAAIKKLVLAKKLQGIADVKDLTDREKGLRLVIEVKNGFHPEALLEQLFKSTPLEESFGINAVALVDGQPRTLGLKEMLEVFLEHRFDVVRRRSAYRRGKAADRLHLVEGLLTAILDIDEVIALIRSSDNAEQARERLVAVFDLTEVQATYILDMPLRRLTKFSKLELDKEAEELRATIAGLDEILATTAACARSSPTSSPRSRRPTARRAAPCCWSPRVRPPGRERRRWRWPTTPASCCSPPRACSPAPPRGRPRHRGRRPLAPRRRRLGGAGHRARRGRGGHLGRTASSSSPCSTCPRCPARRRTRTCRAGRPSASSSPWRASGPWPWSRPTPTPSAWPSAPARASSSGSPPTGSPEGRVGGHRAQGPRRARRRRGAAHRRGGAVLRHQRRPAAALRGLRRAPAGPGGRRHRGRQARGGRPGGLVHGRRRRPDDPTGPSWSRSPAPRPPCRAPRRAR